MKFTDPDRGFIDPGEWNEEDAEAAEQEQVDEWEEEKARAVQLPERIWLQPFGDGQDTTWCEHQINPYDVEYARALWLEWARTELKAARAVLRSIEWGDQNDDGNWCPVCGSNQLAGTHRADCALFAELSKEST